MILTNEDLLRLKIEKEYKVDINRFEKINV